MRLVRQPRHSNTCGHACIAMLADVPIRHVIAALAHDRPTAWKALYSTAFVFGIVCSPELVPVFEVDDMAPVCVVAVPGASQAVGHWVVKYGDIVYDPAVGRRYADELPFQTSPIYRVVKCAVVHNVKVRK